MNRGSGQSVEKVETPLGLVSPLFLFGSFWDALEPGRRMLVIPYGSIQLFKNDAFGPWVYS